MDDVMPVPLKVTLWGLLGASSVKVRVPVREPEAVGLKVTLTVQLAPAAMRVLQLSVSIKSPLTATPLIFRVIFPVFVSVIVLAELVVPTVCLPKERLVGERLTAAAS